MKKIFLLLSFTLVALNSCATYSVSKYNFREMAKVDVGGYTPYYFFAPKDYSYMMSVFERSENLNESYYLLYGKPNDNRSIFASTAFETLKIINIERHAINIFYTNSSVDVDDMLHLVACELAIQKGFSKIIVLGKESSSYNSETTTYTATTYGEITSVRADPPKTSRSETLYVLLFNDYEDIKNGVLLSFQANPESARPFEYLYFTSTNKSLTTSSSTFLNSTSYGKYNILAYKSYYDAEKLAADLREKHNVRVGNKVYEVNILKKTEREPSVLEKNLIKKE